MTIQRFQSEVHKYEGGNEFLDRALELCPEDKGRVWFVNSSKGRKPVIADTEQEAWDKYVERYQD